MSDFNTAIQNFIITNEISKGIDTFKDFSYEAIIDLLSKKNLVSYCEDSEYFQKLVKAINNVDPSDIQQNKIQLYELFALMVYIKSIILFKTEAGREIATDFLTYILTVFCEFRYNGLRPFTTQFIEEIGKLSDEELFMMSPCQSVSSDPPLKQKTIKKLELIVEK